MFGQARNILKEYLSWLARKGRAAEEAVAAAAAAEAAEGQEAMTDVENATASQQQPRPPPTARDILERNRKINNAAAADAVHDFKAVRGDTISCTRRNTTRIYPKNRRRRKII